MKFARIHELPDDEQVLLTVSYDSDSDQYQMTQKTHLNGCEVSISASFTEEEDAVDAMNGYTYERAVDFRQRMIELVSSENED